MKKRRTLTRSLPIVLLLVLAFSADVAGASLVVRHGSRDYHMVALTFDDGWSTDRCRTIADTLRAHDANATFFINGIHLQRSPAAWRAILRGFPVGNHTRSHPWLTRISDDRIRRQIRSNELIHEDILGRPMLKVLRPPYGSYDSDVLRIAAQLGYSRTLLWDVSGVDTSSAATVSSVIRNATRGQNGSVILLHCGPAVTPRALPSIIRYYQDRGYALVGLSRLLGVGT